MINLPKLQDFNFKGKKVLVRLDLDIPAEDDFRLRAELPTIEFLLNQKARIILLGHLDRPKGKVVEKLSLRSVAQKLGELFSSKFKVKSTKLQFKVQNFEAFQILENLILLENLRFYPGEEKNDLEFAKKLASFGVFYVNEAFAASHREHASIVGIPKILPHCAGFNFTKEVENLSKVLENPQRPVVFVVGGAKPETKLPLVAEFAKKTDWVLVGGLLPTSSKFKVQSSKFKNIIWGKLTKDGLDIDENSIKKFKDIIKTARTVVWNGPMGKFEEKKWEEGTRKVAEAIAQSSAFKVVGGGDTVAALNKFGLLSKMDFVSTGGGAMLEFLAKGRLPGIEALG
jgi:phosphoglycerate kinase